MKNYVGLDYSLGMANVDPETGIHFGVIGQNELGESWVYESEADYGEPTCPKCGNGGENLNNDGDNESLRDYYCSDCGYPFDSDEAYGDEPECFKVDDGEYTAFTDSTGDIFVVKSPYYTHAQFCSPCAPGAGYLMDPVADGPKTYCFGHDWFDSGVAPYPVYRVDDGTPVNPKRDKEQ